MNKIGVRRYPRQYTIFGPNNKPKSCLFCKYPGEDSTSPFKISALSSIRVHYGGQMYGVDLELSAPEVSVSLEGGITTDGMGYSAQVGDGAGTAGTFVSVICIIIS